MARWMRRMWHLAITAFGAEIFKNSWEDDMRSINLALVSAFTTLAVTSALAQAPARTAQQHFC